jgi:glycosyltransferase involved in cell wall biosynthesis
MESTTPPSSPARSAPGSPIATVDVVVPVYNEERILTASIRSLHRFLADLPFAARIVIADNASTDATLSIARVLSVELPDVAVMHLEERGRGRALRAAWSTSDADVVCYMDVDLSTDLNALEALVAPLLAGHSDVAVGSRLLFGSHVRRQIKREVLSRGYNRLLRTVLGACFSDAQCGFKALRADALGLLDDVRDDGWFFDTELLVLAQRRGLRIHEVPVNWIEDPDSRVRIVRTAVADLRGVARLALAGALSRPGTVHTAPATRAGAAARGS